MARGEGVSAARTNEAWARNLVGRDWEIYWDENGNDPAQDNKGESPSGGSNTAAPNNEDSDEECEVSEDVTDWYDARVSSFNAAKGIFQVNFLGDETVYEMTLKPSIVRPSARAWIRRARALLMPLKPSGEASDMDTWEKGLSSDTSTLEDQERLEQLKVIVFASSTVEKLSVESSVQKERDDILHLLFLVRSQIYLRSKLAPVVENGETKSSDGEPVPTEAYVNHAFNCLEQLQQLCCWHYKCWLLYEKVVYGKKPSDRSKEVAVTTDRLVSYESSCNGSREGSTYTSTPQGHFSNDKLVENMLTQEISHASLVPVDEVRRSCLNDGRELLISLLTSELTPAAAKRKPVLAASLQPARRTKRRKLYKARGFLQSRADCEGGEHESFLHREEGQFLSTKSLRQFVQKVKSEDNRWFVHHFVEMLLRMCSRIQEPIVRWIKEAELVLGDSNCVDDNDDSGTDEDDESMDGTSINDQMETGTLKEDDEIPIVDGVRYYTYEEVEACMNLAIHREILEQVDLSQWTKRLTDKLGGIVRFEIQAWKLIERLVDDVGCRTKTTDEVMMGLNHMKDDVMHNPHLRNIQPLGGPSSRMTRDVLDNAIAVREWILDLKHVELVRERLSFVQNVVSRAPNLPHVPSPPGPVSKGDSSTSMSSLLDQVMTHVQEVSSKLYSHVHVFSLYERLVAESTCQNDPEGLKTIQGVSFALDKLRVIPVMSLVEEKLAIRADILNWKEKAKRFLHDEKLPYVYLEIAELKKDLDSIYDGQSQSRASLVEGVEPSDTVDSDIRVFARNEVALLCGEATMLERAYLSATQWKDRADLTITALRIHGNPSAGARINANKAPAMVDLKRIDELLKEYETLQVSLPERQSSLRLVRDEANKWTADVEQIIIDDDDHFEKLTSARDRRPKGVLMDPARHVVDGWIDALDWYNRVIQALNNLSAKVEKLASSDAYMRSAMMSTFIAQSIHPLLMEGLEIIELFSRKLPDMRHTVDLEKAISIMSEMQDHHRSMRMLSKTKLGSTFWGNTILCRIVDCSRDADHGAPVFSLLFLHWRLLVIDIVRRHDSVERKDRPTLEEAKLLDSGRPNIEMLSSLRRSACPAFFAVLSAFQTIEVEQFCELVTDGRRAELEARALLNATKDIVRGSLANADEVRNHFAKVKSICTDWKSRSHAGPGLILNPTLEASLDQCAKELSWLVRTFPYPTLHSDDIVDQPGMEENGLNGSEQATKLMLPWDVLVNLYERLPCLESDGSGGEVARVSVRVKELYEAAHAWQEEVSSQMSLSFRGAKRRGLGGPIDPDSSTKVDLIKLAQLAKHPILSRVSMPREAAVREVLLRAREFEIMLSNLLDNDFDGHAPDRAPYPASDSLVGSKDEFVLYRLTGSPLFGYLKLSIERMEKVAEDILADTPGKAAFEWLRKAVSWIEELRDAVTEHSPFDDIWNGKLVIPSSDAKRLLRSGNRLFLDITEDLRKTLADHKVFLSTNKQTEKLTVVVGKGGAHHSVGGTVIRWCPLLLECLKADVSELSQWESRGVAIGHAFKAVALQEMKNQTSDKETIYRWYRFREDVSRLLDEGRDRLVVTPQQTMVQALTCLQNSLDKWANKIIMDSQGILDATTVMKGRYEDGATVVNDRFPLLDALLKRRQIESGATNESCIVVIPDGQTFRDKARFLLERAFRKGMQMVDFDTTGDNDETAFCAMKAWEVENALFAAFHTDRGQRIASDEYREKVRSLKYNLEDLKNPSLCPRVLLSDVDTESLIHMSSEDMASQKVRQTRAKAEEEGKRNATLNPVKVRTVVNRPMKEAVVDGSVKSIIRAALKAHPDAASSPVNVKPTVHLQVPTLSPDILHPLTQPHSITNSACIGDKDELVESTLAPPLQSSAVPSGLPPKSLTPTVQWLPPAPPPPIIIAPAPPPLPMQATGKGAVRSASGADTFSVSITQLKVNFQATFYIENEAFGSMDGLLPERLSDKGRLQIDEFTKFLSGKLSSGRWTAVAMRLSTTSEASAMEYKKFYKEYESRKRIAMFKVGEESKMFLVTPRFHGAAKTLRDLFRNSTSTYAVILMRNR